MRREGTIQRSDKIVVGFDGSEPAADALEWAMHLAEATGQAIESTTVWNLPLGAAAHESMLGSPDLSAKNQGALAEAELVGSRARNIAARRHFPSNRLTISVIAGDAGLILTQKARAASLLVIGSRGRSASKQLLLGSVARSCIHSARGPVAIVPPGSALPVWSRMPIVVRVDGTPGTDRALRWAAEVADHTGAALRLVSTYGRHHQLPGASYLRNRTPQAWAPRHEAEVAADKARATLSDTQTTAATLYEIVEGDPGEVLHDAGRYGAVVVVAEPDHVVVKRFLARSLVNKLVTHPLGPIVVVPDADVPAVTSSLRPNETEQPHG